MWQLNIDLIYFCFFTLLRVVFDVSEDVWKCSRRYWFHSSARVYALRSRPPGATRYLPYFDLSLRDDKPSGEYDTHRIIGWNHYVAACRKKKIKKRELKKKE